MHHEDYCSFLLLMISLCDVVLRCPLSYILFKWTSRMAATRSKRFNHQMGIKCQTVSCAAGELGSQSHS